MLEHFPLKSDNMTLKVPLYRVLDLNAPLFCFVLFCFVSFRFVFLFCLFLFFIFLFFLGGGGQIGMTTVIGGWGGVACYNCEMSK